MFNFCEMECENSFVVTTAEEPSRAPLFLGEGGEGGMEAEAMEEKSRDRNEAL